MDSCEGFILAGGMSSRMGKDKSRLELGGRTFVERIADALTAVTGKVSIVGANPSEDNETFKLPAHVLGDVCSLPLVNDVFEKWGALGGLHGALAASRGEWTAVVACDLPFVTADLFKRLASKRDGFDAVVARQEDGRAQPLCAFYRTSTCRPTAENLIKVGERRPMTLLQSVRTRWVAFAELADLEGANYFFENVNTPDDYARAQLRETRQQSE